METEDGLPASLSDRCVLIGGQPRSGTSLLTSILRSSDQIMQGFELHIRKPSFLVGNNGNYTKNILRQLGLPTEDFRQIVEEYEAYTDQMNLGAWCGPKEDVSAEPLSGRETDKFLEQLSARAKVTSALCAEAARRTGKQRWGFKILGDIVYAKQYAEAFPGAVFVLLVRDPRDHALSVMALNHQREERGQPPFYRTYEEVASGWEKTIRNGRLVLEKEGLRHILVRYEDLVQQTDYELKRLGEFLGFDLSTGREFYKKSFVHDHTRRFKHHDNLKQPINANSIGKWKRAMTDEESNIFLSVAGEEMSRWGYV